MIEIWPGLLSQRGARFDGSGNVQFAAVPTSGSALLVPLLHEASLRVRGDDAKAFLQGQLSSNLERVSTLRGQPAAYCTPKGRVLATFTIWPDDAGYILRLPAALADPIRRRLQMYILRARVFIDDVSVDTALLGLAGAQSVPLARDHFAAVPDEPYALTREGTMSAMALPGGRIEIALPRAQAIELWDRLMASGAQPAGQDAWDAAAVSAGVADVVPTTSDQFIPQMLNLELTGAVAFDKGCYPGQEIVARSQYLGQVKRRLRRFRASQAAAPGTEVLGSDGHAVGAVVLSARNADGTVELLAVIANEAASAPLQLAGDPAPLEPLPLPYEVPTAAGAQTDGR